MGSALENFEKVLGKTQELFTKENELLKQGSLPAEFLEQKKQLLAQLDEALAQLKEATADSASQRSLMRALQDRIMKLLMLDKENEQLLTKQSIGALSSVSVSDQLETLYKKSGQ